ncbi:MAG TPA: arginase [Candidatus Saccharimonadales bacterium]|jgi:arginase|nr:arginase [Candidatus Saccharimonadales bacterium]
MPDSDSTNVSLLGVPLDLGAENLGVDIGPQAFRYQNVVAKLEHAGFQINDLGDVECRDRAKLEPGNPRMHYLDEILRVNREVAAKTEQTIQDDRKLIVLGGDHSINLGAVSGASVALNGQLGLIYFDAHGDMNTEETTLSGNVHGMHLASLMGFGAEPLKDLHAETTKIAKGNLLHIGGSDFDAAELELIAREQLPVFTLFDLLSHNLSPVLKMIDQLADRVPNIWVSLDLDSIDQIYAPGAGMPNAKGLSYREIATLAEYVGEKCNVIGIDVVEYNPLQDIDYKTAELGIELIAKFFGKNYSWYTGYMEKNTIG